MIHINKICKKCNLSLPLSEYYSNKNTKDKVLSSCKKCCIAQVATRTNENKEYVVKKRKEHYSNNKEEYTERNRLNYLKNQEKRKQQQKEYSSKNKNKRKEYESRPEVKAKNNEYVKKYSRSTPEKHLATNIRCSIAIRLREIDSKKDQSTLSIVGLNSWREFKQYIESQFTEGMNWGNYGKNIETDWSIDHIIPISLATTLEEVKKLNHYTNLRPMWHLDNIKKRDSH